MKSENKVKALQFGRKWLPAIVFAVCCAVFLLYFVMTRGVGDHKPPEIHVPEEPLQLSVYAEKTELLSGITAEDHHDGDVTASLVVESISDLYDGNKATVTYAAFDEADNVAKAKRTVEYSDYIPPHFTLSGPLIFAEGASNKVFEIIGAEDVLDGKLNDRVKGTLVQGATSLTQAGMYGVEFRVTNSLGDTAHQVLPVEIVEAKEVARRLELTEYLIYLKTGDSFSPRDYIKEEEPADPAPEVPEPPRQISIESDVDTSRPGTYMVTYTDESERNPLAKTCLLVIVEE